MAEHSSRGGKKRLLFGAGGHAKVVYDLAELSQRSFNYVVVDGVGDTNLLGQDVQSLEDSRLGTGSDFEFVVGIGDNEIRKAKFQMLVELGGCPISLVHPSAVVSKYAALAEGSVIFANSVLNAGVRIGRNVVVNTAAVVDHDCEIGDHAQVCPGVTLSGVVTIGSGVFLGTGAIVTNGIKIGAGSIVGAGSVVVSDLPSGVLAFGCPARVIRPLKTGIVEGIKSQES
jgi:sugar O-acyltransferase (sialic acid O-acetyltransferase NeuD family)